MRKMISDRRAFLRSVGGGTTALVIAGPTAMIVDAGRAWSMTLETLDPETAATLLKVCRHAFPHDMLGDIYYAECVEGLDAKAGADADLAATLKDGAHGLDAVLGVPFRDLSHGTQLEVLRQVETGPFFQAVKGHTVVALYNNPLVWPFFGYQGSSAEFGGYLLRGFQDAGWTVEPDKEASPPPYLG